MPHRPRPFSVRFRKPFWLLVCPDTGRTAVYGVFGELMAEQASDELLAFGIEHHTGISRWGDPGSATRPRRLAGWMDPRAVEKSFLFALRDVHTPTSTVVATPDH